MFSALTNGDLFDGVESAVSILLSEDEYDIQRYFFIFAGKQYWKAQDLPEFYLILANYLEIIQAS